MWCGYLPRGEVGPPCTFALAVGTRAAQSSPTWPPFGALVVDGASINAVTVAVVGSRRPCAGISSCRATTAHRVGDRHRHAGVYGGVEWRRPAGLLGPPEAAGGGTTGAVRTGPSQDTLAAQRPAARLRQVARRAGRRGRAGVCRLGEGVRLRRRAVPAEAGLPARPALGQAGRARSVGRVRRALPAGAPRRACVRPRAPLARTLALLPRAQRSAAPLLLRLPAEAWGHPPRPARTRGDRHPPTRAAVNAKGRRPHAGSRPLAGLGGRRRRARRDYLAAATCADRSREVAAGHGLRVSCAVADGRVGQIVRPPRPQNRAQRPGPRSRHRLPRPASPSQTRAATTSPAVRGSGGPPREALAEMLSCTLRVCEPRASSSAGASGSAFC